MARRLVWTNRAQTDRKMILTYWNRRNQSAQYSKKLNALFKEAIHLITERPYIGKPTSTPNVRAKVVRDYLIFYEITQQHIVVLTIWDCRQNPKNLQAK